MLVVTALGGNALLRRGEPMEAAVLRRNLEAAATLALAPIARLHRLVVTHGNGPQIGLLALQAAALHDVQPYPLDVLGAESQGMIGYLIERSLANVLPDHEIAALLTQVEVDPADPAFGRPAKPIGPVYGKDEVEHLSAQTNWAFVPDGAAFRRAVPSPRPGRIHGIGVIKRLVDAGVIVVCAGGGGIPVVATGGETRGVEAVIDKDLTSALLAAEIGADLLLLLTDVSAVWTRWPMSEGRPLGRVTPAELRSLSLDVGSMAPKVEAACRFVETTGRTAVIGAVEQAVALLGGDAGTVVTPDRAPGQLAYSKV